jgi:outer membrane protein assembly factor BamA
MQLSHKIYLVTFFLFIKASLLFGQSDTTVLRNAIPQKDLIDYLRHYTKSKGKAPDTSMRVGKLYKTYLPVLGYGPAVGFVFGGGISFSSLLGKASSTHISSALLNASVTTKEQFYMNLRTNLYLPNDKWILQGDFRIMLYAQPTYGLGIHKNESDSGQNMRFNYFRFYEKVYRNVAKHFYMGMGVQLDKHFQIRDEQLDLDLPGLRVTDHYAYSQAKGFDPEKYTTLGLSLDVLYDSRDNSINCYKGAYAQLSYRQNLSFLGSTQSSSSLFYDLRKYIVINNRATDKSILAFWSWGQFNTSGNIPYLALPSIGWDTYNRSGRGYVQGRLRGTNMMYLESEYRFPLTANGFLGAVVFVNGTTASSDFQKQSLFNSTAIGYGAGFRVKMDKRSRTSIGVDLGMENGNTRRIYFNLQECF